MTSYIFQTLAQKGKVDSVQTKDREYARDWFRDTARRVKTVNRAKMMNDPQNVVETLSTQSIGKMYSFFYDPKNKDTLPYYDQFPLIFMIGPKDKGFMGINLHYLPPVFRAKLMDSLYTIINNQRYDQTTKLKISYELLNNASRFRYFKPCLKHYLFDHVQSHFLNIQPEFWDAALMLPTEKFRKADIDTVWNQSRSRVNG